MIVHFVYVEVNCRCEQQRSTSAWTSSRLGDLFVLFPPPPLSTILTFFPSLQVVEKAMLKEK